MRPLLVLVSMLALTACAMRPQGVDDASVTRFNDAVYSMGCELVTEPHYLATELQAGMTRSQVVGMIRYNVALDRAAPKAGGGYSFTAGACADAA